jgi:tetratricopeptide (TPR) repeat protein
MNATMQRAIALEEINRWDEALELYVELSNADPSDDFPKCRVATALQRLGRLDDAHAAATSAVVAFPNSYRAFNALGEVLRAMGRDGEALEAYLRAADHCPHLALLHRNVAIAAKNTGDLRLAVEAVARAIDLDPTDPWNHLMAGSVELHTKDYDAAEAHIRRSLALAPEDAECHRQLARVAELRGEWATAIEGFTTTLRLDPLNSWAPKGLLNAMIRQRLDRGEIDDAEGIITDYMERFAELDHGEQSLDQVLEVARRAGYHCFAIVGRYDAALDLLDRELPAARRNADTPFLRARLARQISTRAEYLNRLGRHDEAISCAEEALDIARAVHAAEPSAHGDCLQEALEGLTATLAAAGELQRSVLTARERVVVCRELPTTLGRDEHLVWALCALSERLASVNDWSPALAAIDEAVAMRERKFDYSGAASDGSRYAEELAHQASHLLGARRVKEACTTSRAAHDLHRRFVTPADRHMFDRFLVEHAKVLDGAKEHEEAVMVLDEAIASMRELVTRHIPIFTFERLQSNPDRLSASLEEALLLRERILAARATPELH